MMSSFPPFAPSCASHDDRATEASFASSPNARADTAYAQPPTSTAVYQQITACPVIDKSQRDDGHSIGRLHVRQGA